MCRNCTVFFPGLACSPVALSVTVSLSVEAAEPEGVLGELMFVAFVINRLMGSIGLLCKDEEVLRECFSEVSRSLSFSCTCLARDTGKVASTADIGGSLFKSACQREESSEKYSGSSVRSGAAEEEASVAMCGL